MIRTSNHKSVLKILFLVILLITCFGSWLPLKFYQILYAISLSIKSVILVILPFIIFSLLFRTTIQLAQNATKIISLILIAICCSNFVATFISHIVGTWIYNFNLSILLPNNSNILTPYWNFSFPKLIDNQHAMFVGIIVGIIGNFYNNKFVKHISIKLELMVSLILKTLTYLIPLFISGFIAKLQYEGIVTTIIKDYFLIFTIIAVAQITYIVFAYFLLNNCKLKELVFNIKNMLPAAISGFSTMSSAASMPLTIIGVENSTKIKNLARSVVPVTVNVHLIGDCFAIPILAYAVIKNYSMAEPFLINYTIFTFYFVLAKFSVAAVPGGGILVMLPILEKYLGFNSDMTSLITALYILFDPVITCINILGNGAFAKGIDKIWVYLENKNLIVKRVNL